MMNEDSHVDSTVDPTEKVPIFTDITSETADRNYRGVDRKPRIVNRNSIQNLKQCRDNPELTDLIFAKYTPKNNTMSLDSKMLIGLLILGLILFGGWIIWKIYKRHMENRPK